MENKLPKDWKMSSLVNDLPFIKTGVTDYHGKKKYFSTGSIKYDGITEEGEYAFNEKPSRANRIGIKGDVLQARMKATDKAIFIDSKLEGQLFSTGFFQIRPIEGILNNKYIFYYLTSLNFNQIKDELCSGSTQSALNDENAKKILIPIAPFIKQKLIVSKIEELFSELDNGIANLITAQLQLKTYRQSVLKWALENDSFKNYILKDVTEKIQIGPFGTQLHKEDYIENGIPLINPTHIKNGIIVEDNSFTILKSKRDSLPNYILKIGDVIMGRRGEMGRCGLVTKKHEGWFCGTGSLYFRPNFNLLNPTFLYYHLVSKEVKKYLDENAGGTTMANLNLKIVNNIPISLPPIHEQDRIIQEIESRLSVADKMEESINQSLQQAEALRQSILKKAFEGKLI